MFDLYLFLDVIVMVALFALATVILLGDRSNILNRIFAYFVFSINVWIIANYISNSIDYSTHVATIANYFVFSFSYAASIFLLQFVIKLTDDKKVGSIFKKLYIPLWIIAIISATPLVVAGVHLQDNLYAVQFGPLSTVYFVSLIINIAMSIFVVHRNYKKAEGINRERLGQLLRSLYLTFPILILAQAVIPALTGWFGLTNIGVLPMIILVMGLYYNVVKYKLFDIKVFAVRAFVYAITTTFLVTVYSAVSLPIKNLLVSVNTDYYISTLVEIILLGIFGISFYPLKLYFDRVTTKYFFRDHYNVQEVLKNINAILSVSIDLNKMLHRVGGILKNTLLVEHCAFIIDEDKITGQIRYINVGKSVASITLPKGIDKLFRGRNVVVVDQLKDEGLEQELKKYLLFQSIAVLVKLRGVEEHGHIENQGYIILGNKKSGKGFSGQDEKMLDILSAQLAVAAQNLVHLDEIVHFNIKLQDEITDATKELKVKNKKLRELDQTKDEFVSMASHQLRTPLTAIKGYLSMVLEGDAGELKPGQKQLLDQAYMSTQRMVYLIADLLNLSRLKTGKFLITPQPTSLAGMIEGEIHQIEETAKSRGHKVSFMCDPSIPDLMLDDMKTRQVIMNFIDNAIYYTPTGGKIQVFLEQKDGKVVFKVTDNGIGVAKEDQRELFAKFYRAGNARKARPDGTGLGLYMAKMVIDAEGGELIFSSEVGKGSTFGFSFDIEQLKAPAMS